MTSVIRWKWKLIKREITSMKVIYTLFYPPVLTVGFRNLKTNKKPPRLAEGLRKIPIKTRKVIIIRIYTFIITRPQPPPSSPI